MTDPCSKVASRVRHDAARGHTTSEAAKEFIRRTHDCEACREWRRKMMTYIAGES